MGTKRLGIGIVVSSGDPITERAVQRARRRRTSPKDFFTANGISHPSALLDTLPDTYYFAKDIDGRFVWGNRLLQEKYHLPRAEDIVGTCDHDFLRRDIADRIRADDLAVMSGEAIISNKFEMIGDLDGAPSWLCTSKTVLRNKRGEVVGVEGISRRVPAAQGTPDAAPT
jgi:PAS domain-containing protein